MDCGGLVVVVWAALHAPRTYLQVSYVKLNLVKCMYEYLLTIMCTTMRNPEAIPLRRITSKLIIPVLTRFFTQFGLPRVVQSDQGSNFTSGIFQQVMDTLGIKQYLASAYHPESQDV